MSDIKPFNDKITEFLETIVEETGFINEYYLKKEAKELLEQFRQLEAKDEESLKQFEKDFYTMFYKTVGEKGAIHSQQIWEYFKPRLECVPIKELKDALFRCEQKRDVWYNKLQALGDKLIELEEKHEEAVKEIEKLREENDRFRRELDNNI